MEYNKERKKKEK